MMVDYVVNTNCIFSKTHKKKIFCDTAAADNKDPFDRGAPRLKNRVWGGGGLKFFWMQIKGGDTFYFPKKRGAGSFSFTGKKNKIQKS